MKIAHRYYVYVILCKDGSYYTGINDLERRLWEHNSGYKKSSYTYTRRSVELKYHELFTDVNRAYSLGKAIKRVE